MPILTLNLIYQNVRGLNTKLSYFRQNLLSLECDVVAITESFLTEAVNDSEISCGGWTVLRRDRATGAMGGGVLVVARHGLELKRHRNLETTNGEDLWVSFVVDSVTVNLCVVYIPPGSPETIYMQWFHAVESAMNTVKGLVLVVGDLNLNPLYTPKSILSYYCYFLTVCGLKEMNEVMNTYGGKLDVVLVSECFSGTKVNEMESVGLVSRRDAYHPPLEVSVDYNRRRLPADRIDPSNVDLRRDWNFGKGNYEFLCHLIKDVSWREVLDAAHINSAVENFYDIVYSIFDMSIPKKVRSGGSSRCYPVWFTADLIKDIKRKGHLHREWKATKSKVIYDEFARLRSAVKKHISSAYDRYLYRIQARIKDDPRAFWQHLDSLKSRSGFASRVTFEGREYAGSEVASAFSNFFSSVFLSGVPRLDPDFLRDSSQSCNANYINIAYISMEEIEKAVKCLKPNCSVGPDNLPAYIVKGCIDQLKVPIHFMFNLALSSGVYPHQWKLTRVRPIPKTNDAVNVENYRPVAVLSTLAKLFESVLHRALSPQIKPFLGDSQHGFRLNRSVNTNLLVLVDIISEHLDRGIQVDVLYFDFKKAFDRVDNEVLLNKLKGIGFSPRMLKFFSSYLRDRQQYVRHGCYVSAPYHTRSGVSQGSVLGPLLFNLMVNDLELVLKSARCLLYADDLKLVYGVERRADYESLQDDVNAVFRWSVENKLLFNPDKCFVCTFSRARAPLHVQYMLGSQPINRVFSVKDLGVVFDPRLTFHGHIETLAASCFRRLGFVIRNVRDFCNTDAIRIVYNALVRSKLETSSLVWNPHEAKYTSLLEKVQKAFLRFLYKKIYGYYPYLYPTKYLLGTLGYNSLEVRRNYSLLVSVCQVLRGEADCLELVAQTVKLAVPDVPRITRRARRRDLLAVPAARTVSHRNSPIHSALTILNKLLASAPECDIFAWGRTAVYGECLRYCERMDDRESTVLI